ncbi:MAG: hypothetical protein RLY16_2710, partial [Bacteroidota bacterium]
KDTNRFEAIQKEKKTQGITLRFIKLKRQIYTSLSATILKAAAN